MEGMTINTLISEIIEDKNCLFDPKLSLNQSSKLLAENIKNLVTILGIKLLNLDPSNSVLWDGYYLRCKKITVANILHEIGHFQVAKDHHRYKIDFALGRGPESLIIIDDKHCINKYASLQEEYASVLGILWMKYFKITTFFTFVEHTWGDTDESINRFKKIVEKLHIKGFLSDKYEPLAKHQSQQNMKSLYY